MSRVIYDAITGETKIVEVESVEAPIEVEEYLTPEQLKIKHLEEELSALKEYVKQL